MQVLQHRGVWGSERLVLGIVIVIDLARDTDADLCGNITNTCKNRAEERPTSKATR
jgi:hypothetical protein